MAENKKFECTGNCLNCLPAQRGYCASQHAYSNMKVLDTMMGMVISMRESIKAIGDKIYMMEAGELSLFDPSAKQIAQEGAGAIE